jgi:hypothetical protein
MFKKCFAGLVLGALCAVSFADTLSTPLDVCLAKEMKAEIIAYRQSLGLPAMTRDQALKRSDFCTRSIFRSDLELIDTPHHWANGSHESYVACMAVRKTTAWNLPFSPDDSAMYWRNMQLQIQMRKAKTFIDAFDAARPGWPCQAGF